MAKTSSPAASTRDGAANGTDPATNLPGRR